MYKFVYEADEHDYDYTDPVTSVEMQVVEATWMDLFVAFRNFLQTRGFEIDPYFGVNKYQVVRYNKDEQEVLNEMGDD